MQFKVIEIQVASYSRLTYASIVYEKNAYDVWLYRFKNSCADLWFNSCDSATCAIIKISYININIDIAELLQFNQLTKMASDKEDRVR